MPVPSNQTKVTFILFYPSTWYICDFFLFHIESEGKCGGVYWRGRWGKGMLPPPLSNYWVACPPPPPPLPTHMIKVMSCAAICIAILTRVLPYRTDQCQPHISGPILDQCILHKIISKEHLKLSQVALQCYNGPDTFILVSIIFVHCVLLIDINMRATK